MGSNHFTQFVGIAGCFQELVFLKNKLFLEKDRADTAETTALYGEDIVFTVDIDRERLILR